MDADCGLTINKRKRSSSVKPISALHLEM